MATTHVNERTRPSPYGVRRSAGQGISPGVFLLLSALVIGAGAFVCYVLWPRWPAPDATDVPSLPITVAGVAFNVPPAAMRVKLQRHAGAHERVDLAFLWPLLTPPDPMEKSRPPAPDAVPIHSLDRVFVTIMAADDTLPPDERIKSIYPRYAANTPAAGPQGLAILAFREDTPYQGEDLIYDARQPDNFLVRCTRDGAGPTPGICLYARRIDNADLVVRFPRDWLGNWLEVKRNIARLIAGLRPHPRQS